MPYTKPSFSTKKALKEAVREGKLVTVYEPGGIGVVPTEGWVEGIEGPSFRPHTWYAAVKLADGKVVGVR